MKNFKEHLITEAIEFHIETKRPFCDNTFRPYTDEFYQLYIEAKRLYKHGKIDITESFERQVLESDIGEFAMYDGEKVPLDLPLLEDKKEELNKPKRGGSKKFYVYVKNEKGNIQKVSFGAKEGGGNLSVKINDPKARASFAARHKCDQANDKTTPKYWACRLPRYAKSLGLKVDSPGAWW